MLTLQERLAEVMQSMNWQHADVVRISGQSSSVVSQWLGKGSKEIKTIGQLEAALALADASGYAPLWIAKGMGSKKPQNAHLKTLPNHRANEPDALFASPEQILEGLRRLLAQMPIDLRGAVADLLAGMAREGGDRGRMRALMALLEARQQNHDRAA